MGAAFSGEVYAAGVHEFQPRVSTLGKQPNRDPDYTKGVGQRLRRIPTTNSLPRVEILS